MSGEKERLEAARQPVSRPQGSLNASGVEDSTSAEPRRELPKGITRCWQNFGFHVYGAGPCCDTLEQAERYKASLDAEGVTWRRQP